jgi:hypothetical protein
MMGILSGLESLYVSPITPLNGGSGAGSTADALAGGFPAGLSCAQPGDAAHALNKMTLISRVLASIFSLLLFLAI